MARSKTTFKEYFIEFVIVLLGITIAFWLSNLGEEQKKKSLESVYIQDLYEDLKKDSIALEYSIKESESKLKKLSKLIPFYNNQPSEITIDSLPYYANLIGTYSFFSPNDYTYISLQQSGDFSLLKDRNLKRSLIEIYEEYEFIELEQTNVINALDQNYFPVLMKNLDLLTGEIVNQAYFETAEFRNSVAFMINETYTLIRFYKSAKARIGDFQETL